MKIIYITASFPYGLGESFLIPEIIALKDHGINLTIVPIFPRGELRKDWNGLSGDYKLYTENILSFKVFFSLISFTFLHPIIFLKLLLLLRGSNLNQLIKNIVILPKSIWLTSIIKKENPDHLHAHWGSTTSTSAMLSTSITSTKWSFTCHRWDIYENNLLSKKSEKASFIRFISKKGASDALKYNVSTDKSTVIPMGTRIPTDVSIREWNKSNSDFLIICPANLIPVKGHKYLIEAMELLVKQSYPVKLFLAGEGPLRNELEALINEKGLKDKVIFMGQLTHNALINLYKKSKVHLMVLPSLDLGNGEHEGVPVSLMEAMSYGIPVISTNTGSINELLPKEIGLTVPDKNANELANMIMHLYDNPNEYKKYSKLCLEIIELNWDVNLSAHKLLLYIKKCS